MKGISHATGVVSLAARGFVLSGGVALNLEPNRFHSLEN